MFSVGGQNTFTSATEVTITHPCPLSLSYQRNSSWDTVMKLARPSNIIAVDTSCCTTAIIR